MPGSTTNKREENSPDGLDSVGENTLDNVDSVGGNTLDNIDNDGGNNLGDVDNAGGNALDDVDNVGGNTLDDVDNIRGNTLDDVDNVRGNNLGDVDNVRGDALDNIDNVGGDTLDNIDSGEKSNPGGEGGYVQERMEGLNEHERRELEGIVEGVLFAAGDAVKLEKLASIIGLNADEAKILLSNMAISIRASKRGLLLREIDGKYQLSTRPEHSQYINKLLEERPRQNLSQAAYEALSIIAYNSNVTRAAIEKIRGVNSDSSIDRLLERNLIRETGKLNVPGRPMAYDVTDEFFRRFGYSSKADLPNK